MLIYDIAERERVFDIVTNNLRSLGIKHRVKRNSKKANGIDNKDVEKNRKIFNVPLSHQLLDEVQLSSGAIVNVPIFVKNAIIYLDKYINQEGLFRKAGSQSRLKELVSCLDSGNGLGEKYHGIDVANCLKKYFRDLPEPIIPYAYHDLFVRCGMLKVSKVKAILLACLLLPSIHLNTLAAFMDFLRRVSMHESQNKMTTDNLAKIIGPNIMPLRETSMSAMQTRLEAHLYIVKILIENAQRIGVLPRNITDIIQNELCHNTEMEVDRIPEDRSKDKKKKHRNGSLTRMFNGLKKIVGKNGSPEAHLLMNEHQSKAPASDSSTISLDKIPKKRKIVEVSIPPASVKKKRSSLNVMFTPPTSLSPISQDPNPTDKSISVHKCRMRKFIPHIIQPEIINYKMDKPKILGLNLDRFVSCSRQKIDDSEVENKSQDFANSPIERRWSLANSTQKTLKKRKSQNWSASSLIASTSIKRQRELFPKNANECYDHVFMDANVNLSDEDIACDNIDQSIEQMQHRSTKFYPTAKNDLKDTRNKSDDENSVNKIYIQDEEYVKIPKSEYEEIKNRVSAIESRISQEFNSIIDHDQTKKLPIVTASEVQSEYEKTLGEASIGSIISADHLARRLSKELKIRRSSEHKVIRSPSARRISNIRRRSQDKPITPRKCVNRTSPWQVSEKTAENDLTSSITSQQNQNNIDTFCSDATNSRLTYLHQQLSTLISHTAEHTGSQWEDEEMSSNVINPAKSIGDGVRRASSFNGNGRTSGLNYYNSRIGELRKMYSQQNIVHEDEQNTKYDGSMLEMHEKRLSWKNATSYLEYETPKKSTYTPTAIQSGRASLAKLRTQNAGMVLAKAKLFDHNESKNGQELFYDSHKNQSGYHRSKELKLMSTPTETSRKRKSKSPKNNGARLKILQSSNDSSSTSYLSQRQSFNKCENRRPSLTLNQGNQCVASEFLWSSHNEVSKLTNVKNSNSSSRVHTTISSVSIQDENLINRVGENENVLMTSSVINTPHIKKPLSLKTPKSARSLVRRPPIDTRRTPMKAVPASLNTPKRQSPKTTFKSRQITRNIDIN